MARVTLPDVTVTIASRPAHSSTTVSAVGAYVVVVATALPDHGVTLTSAYLAEPRGDIAAAHLLVAAGPLSAPQHRLLPGAQAGQTHARMCLLDHAAQLQGALHVHTDEVVAIEVSPAALSRADAAWAQP